MKNLYLKLLSMLVLCTVCFFSSISFVFAEQDGSGGGPGPDAKLKLEECNIYDGMEDADTNLNIVMRFTKNVADLTVVENNEKAISLKTKTGEDVDYEIHFPEEFAKRQYIEINANLEPNTEYVLSLDTTLMARNGINYLWKDYEINFSTGDEEKENISLTTVGTDSEKYKDINENANKILGVLLLVFVVTLIIRERGNKNV